MVLGLFLVACSGDGAPDSGPGTDVDGTTYEIWFQDWATRTYLPGVHVTGDGVDTTSNDEGVIQATVAVDALVELVVDEPAHRITHAYLGSDAVPWFFGYTLGTDEDYEAGADALGFAFEPSMATVTVTVARRNGLKEGSSIPGTKVSIDAAVGFTAVSDPSGPMGFREGDTIGLAGADVIFVDVAPGPFHLTATLPKDDPTTCTTGPGIHAFYDTYVATAATNVTILILCD